MLQWLIESKLAEQFPIVVLVAVLVGYVAWFAYRRIERIHERWRVSEKELLC